MKNCMKFHTFGARSFHADGQTDRYEASSTPFFCNFANALKNGHAIIITNAKTKKMSK